MSALVIAGDTSGTITIEAPAVAGTNTITLPASSGTLATTAGGVTGLDSSGGVARATSGLLFNADTAAANILDDYEEGTFTATLTGSTSQPATALTASVAKYTKVGNIVHIAISFDAINTVSYAGNVAVTGLPFTVGTGRSICTIGVYNVVTFTEDLIGEVFGATQVVFYSSKSNAPWSSATHNATSPGYIWVTGTYNV